MDKSSIHDGAVNTPTREQVVIDYFNAWFDPDINGTHKNTFISGFAIGEQHARADLEAQLKAAQVENERLENQVLARDAELWGNTQEILALKDQLASAEQRTAEACAKTCTEYDVTPWEHDSAALHVADMVSASLANSIWRKFVKGE